MKPFSLYLHIPFCFHKCPYCDFNTYAVSSFPEKEYTGALLAELDYRAAQPEWSGREVQTIFFGGGTPSLFAPVSIRKIVSAICTLFPVSEQVEISLEANPGTVTAESLLGYAQAGVNRLSLGAQSFLPDTLKALGRVHTPEQTEVAIHHARAAGISNINVDLMYGAPHQTLGDVRSDLAEAVRLGVTHISAYHLTIEKGTEFFTANRRGTLRLPKEGAIVQMMEGAIASLSESGFVHYEVSNFAKPGFHARHNLAYWNHDDYLGLGAGAHSYRFTGAQGSLWGSRWSNYAAPKQYIDKATGQGDASCWKDNHSLKDEFFEHIFLGLRKRAGVALHDFATRYRCTLQTLYPTLLSLLETEGLIGISDNAISLTSRGLLLADSVIENFAEPEFVPPLEHSNGAALIGGAQGN